jgi:hypothetical protein
VINVMCNVVGEVVGDKYYVHVIGEVVGDKSYVQCSW